MCCYATNCNTRLLLHGRPRYIRLSRPARLPTARVEVLDKTLTTSCIVADSDKTLISYSKMKQEQALRTTFGQLEHVADKVILPSTLNYRERTEMQKRHGCEYGRIYNFSNSLSVYDRLTADAAVRQNVKSMRTPAAASADVDLKLATAPPTRATASCSSANVTLPSGFVSNNNTPMLTRTFHEVAGLDSTTQNPPLETLHPLTLKSYKNKFPLDFLAAARPAAQTTNQTMRMLGTYTADEQLARLINARIPAVGIKPGCFHPDVKC